MTNQEIKNGTLNCINTLNTIEIKGRENLNRLLGVILLLEKIAAEIDIPEIEIGEVKPDAEEAD